MAENIFCRVVKAEKLITSLFNGWDVVLVNQKWKMRKTTSLLLMKYFSQVELLFDFEDTVKRINDRSKNSPKIIIFAIEPTEKEIEYWAKEYDSLLKPPIVFTLCHKINDKAIDLSAKLSSTGIIQLDQTDQAIIDEMLAAVGETKNGGTETQSESETEEVAVEEDISAASKMAEDEVFDDSYEEPDVDVVKTGNKHLDELAEKLKIPPPPETIIKLQKLMEGKPRANEVGEIIEADYKLKNTVLKLLNAQFFNFGVKSKISSIAHAINLVGMDSLVSITYAMALKTTLSYRTGRISDFAYRFWKYSFANSIACVYLTPRVEEFWLDFSVGKAFLLGAVHNSGMLLMAKEFDGYSKSLDIGWKADPDGRTQCTIEDEQYGFDHALVSFAIAKVWNLPHEFHDPILHHHDLEDSDLDDEKTKSLHDMLLLSNYMTNNFLFTNYDFTLLNEIIEPVAKEFGESLASIKKIREKVRSQLMLNINTLSR